MGYTSENTQECTSKDILEDTQELITEVTMKYTLEDT